MNKAKKKSKKLRKSKAVDEPQVPETINIRPPTTSYQDKINTGNLEPSPSTSDQVTKKPVIRTTKQLQRGSVSHQFLLNPDSIPDLRTDSLHVISETTVEKEQKRYQDLVQHPDDKTSSVRSIARIKHHHRHRVDLGSIAELSTSSSESSEEESLASLTALNKIPDYPPELEILAISDILCLKEVLEEMEIFSGYKARKKYAVINTGGDCIYYAAEDVNLLPETRLRPFRIRILDLEGIEVMKMTRPFACYPLCRQKLMVHDIQGVLYGSIKQDWTLLKPRFTVRTATGEKVLSIVGPMCPYRPLDADKCDFYVEALNATEDEKEVGRISKYWTSICEPALDAAISFPGDLDVRIKAVMLGALFLIVSMKAQTR